MAQVFNIRKEAQNVKECHDVLKQHLQCTRCGCHNYLLPPGWKLKHRSLFLDPERNIRCILFLDKSITPPRYVIQLQEEPYIKVPKKTKEEQKIESYVYRYLVYFQNTEQVLFKRRELGNRFLPLLEESIKSEEDVYRKIPLKIIEHKNIRPYHCRSILEYWK